MILCLAPAVSALKSLICLPLMIVGLWQPSSETVIKHYYVNGALCQEYHCTNGIPNGIVKEYYEDGALASECSVVSGKRQGPDTFYYRNGAIERVIYFRNDRKEWMRRYTHSGILAEELWYNDGDIALRKLYDGKGKLTECRDISVAQKRSTVRR